MVPIYRRNGAMLMNGVEVEELTDEPQAQPDAPPAARRRGNAEGRAAAQPAVHRPSVRQNAEPAPASSRNPRRRPVDRDLVPCQGTCGRSFPLYRCLSRPGADQVRRGFDYESRLCLRCIEEMVRRENMAAEGARMLNDPTDEEAAAERRRWREARRARGEVVSETDVETDEEETEEEEGSRGH